MFFNNDWKKVKNSFSLKPNKGNAKAVIITKALTKGNIWVLCRIVIHKDSIITSYAQCDDYSVVNLEGDPFVVAIEFHKLLEIINNLS